MTILFTSDIAAKFAFCSLAMFLVVASSFIPA